MHTSIDSFKRDFEIKALSLYVVDQLAHRIEYRGGVSSRIIAKT